MKKRQYQVYGTIFVCRAMTASRSMIFSFYYREASCRRSDSSHGWGNSGRLELGLLRGPEGLREAGTARGVARREEPASPSRCAPSAGLRSYKNSMLGWRRLFLGPRCVDFSRFSQCGGSVLDMFSCRHRTFGLFPWPFDSACVARGRRGQDQDIARSLQCRAGALSRTIMSFEAAVGLGVGERDHFRFVRRQAEEL